MSFHQKKFFFSFHIFFSLEITLSLLIVTDLLLLSSLFSYLIYLHLNDYRFDRDFLAISI